MQTPRICLQNGRFAFLNEFPAPFTIKLGRIYSPSNYVLFIDNEGLTTFDNVAGVGTENKLAKAVFQLLDEQGVEI